MSASSPAPRWPWPPRGARHSERSERVTPRPSERQRAGRAGSGAQPPRRSGMTGCRSRGARHDDGFARGPVRRPHRGAPAHGGRPASGVRAACSPAGPTPWVRRSRRSSSEFATAVGTARAVGVGSGTAALQLLLQAAGVSAGDEVVLPPNSFAATAEAVAVIGAVPVFADVDPATGQIDPTAVREALTPRTAAVIAVHLYGHPTPMDELRAITEPAGIRLFEDRRAGLRGDTRRQSGGLARRRGGLQLLSGQEPGRTRGSRRGHD